MTQLRSLDLTHTLRQAANQHKAGQLQEAQQLYQAVLQTQPHHPVALHNLGALTMQLGQTNVALAHFKAAKEANPNQRLYWLSYINALLQVGQASAAHEVLIQGCQQGLSGNDVEALLDQVTQALTAANRAQNYRLERRIALPLALELETQSTCNRTCTSCIRNSNPDKEAVKDWFEVNQMPTDLIVKAYEDAIAMGFRGILSLSHYNEPLQDERLPQLLRFSQNYPFSARVIHTNADLLTEELAQELDGLLTSMTVALYYDEPQKSKRMRWIQSLFKKTQVSFTGGIHIVTHFSPRQEVNKIIHVSQHNPCFEPVRRLILNHRGQMLLCCDDMIGHFDLGVLGPQTSLEELWFSQKHQDMVLNLTKANSRLRYPHCATCPRSGIGQEVVIEDVRNAAKARIQPSFNPS